MGKLRKKDTARLLRLQKRIEKYRGGQKNGSNRKVFRSTKGNANKIK